MKCDICGKETKTWGHCVCLECYTTPKEKTDDRIKEALYHMFIEMLEHETDNIEYTISKGKTKFIFEVKLKDWDSPD